MGDEAVHATNDDATRCKRSAVQYGYWRDPYIAEFVNSRAERKAPEIHLGYFTRVLGLRHLLQKVLDQVSLEGRPVQIISLGAGFDTLFWRLKDELPSTVHLQNFIEVDFPAVTAKKCFLIKKSKKLLKKVVKNEEDDVKLSRTDLHGHGYHVVGADFTDPKALETKLADCSVDFACPTVFLAECVLVYVSPSKTDTFLSWALNKFSSVTPTGSVPTPLVFLNHEQIHMNDRFGAVMLDNLSARGCGLPGVSACVDKQTQIRRFLGAAKSLVSQQSDSDSEASTSSAMKEDEGSNTRKDVNKWDSALCWTMSEVYNELLPRDEVARVESLEMFDEKELMRQLFDHYCLAIAWRNGRDILFDDIDFW